MESKDLNINKKHFYITIYKDLLQLEKAIERIKIKSDSKLELSILGKLNQGYSKDTAAIEPELRSMRSLCEKLLGSSADFGSFYNAELGVTFISGALFSTFLRNVGGKPLAVLSTGPYGIFRGIGASEAEANKYIKALNMGQYLLIIRGLEKDL